MAIERIFECDKVREIVKKFFKGSPIKELASEYNTGTGTIRNMLFRVTYKDCFSPTEWFSSEELYFDAVNETLKNNLRLSKGRGVKK